MALDLSQIREAVSRPKHSDVIKAAGLLQARLRFHTDVNVSEFTWYRPQSGFNRRGFYGAPAGIGQPLTAFLDWVEGFLPRDKFNVFRSLLKMPFPTTAVVEDVYRELERVFYSRNASSAYQFTDSEFEEDWVAYRRDRLGEPDIWKREGWRRMQVSPNDILVVDLPEAQSGARPEPYFYWVSFNDVIDYKAGPDHIALEWLIFRQSGGRLAVFDDESIRVFELDEDDRVGGLITGSEHGLGYCPARFFWSNELNGVYPDIKKNPLAKELTNLDWYLFFAISKRHLDLYAPYPIYSAYESECGFENSETGDYCDGGFLRNAHGEYKVLNNGSVEKCPCCSDKRIAGPGSFLEVPIPNQTEGIVDMRNPIQITTIDREALEYNVNECERLKNEIIMSVIGFDDAVTDKEAVNDIQVKANFESKTSVLNSLKTNFESAQKFVDDTVCRLRYGAGFVSSSISWGTEFYVFTVDELYDRYAKAKANGAFEAELDALRWQIMEVEYKNNPTALQRMRILSQLEPYPHKTLDEMLSLYEKGLIDDATVRLKANFMGYVTRFERENINIVEFASNLSLGVKIGIINKKLLEYANGETAVGKTE
jgi:hypothetical protein